MSFSDDVTIRAMVRKHGACEAYHQGFGHYMRSTHEESKERWVRILTRLKAMFPEGGCEHVVR